VGPDYLLVHEKHADKLCIELVKTLKKQFSSDPRKSGIGRIVHVAHAQRLVELLKEVEKSTTAKILFGGSSQCDPDSKYVCPTIVFNPPRDSRMLNEEIFGPILPVIVVKSREEAIEFINSMPGTPLAMYIYTSSASVYRQMKDSCPTASAMRNDGLLHFANNHLPVGGLGSSGYGNYHGKFSFETFTHAFSCMYRPCFPGCDFGMLRYPPFGKTKADILTKYLVHLPEVPVLPWRPALGVIAVALFLKYVPGVQPLTMLLKKSLADILEAAVLWLRSDAN
jgi:acyl-CoA reductase-like NAD-dependent aldehyde dehydrogenase